MKKLRKYLFKVRKDLLVILFVAIFTYFFNELYLNNLPELFKGANKIGQFFSKLSISYISAFIFYFIVVHIKNEKDKENINEYVGQKVHNILTCAHLFIQPFLQIENKNAKFNDLDIKKLRTLLNSIDRNAKDSPYIIDGQKASWLEWYEYLKTSTFKSINEIFMRSNHIDTKLIKTLTRVENNFFFTQWNLLYNFDFDNSFGLYSEQTKMYLVIISELQEYADKNLSEYQNQTLEFSGYKPKY